MQQQILYKKNLRKKSGFCLPDDLFTANDLYLFKKPGVYNFKITLIVFVLPVNRKVYIFKLHGESVFKIRIGIYSRKIRR